MKVEATHMEEITILTLSTDDGFSVSFGLKADDLKCLGLQRSNRPQQGAPCRRQELMVQP